MPGDVASVPRTADVVFTFAMEMLEDAVRRESGFPTDQALLALARDERIGSLVVVAHSWRSYVTAAARRRSLSLTMSRRRRARYPTRAPRQVAQGSTRRDLLVARRERIGTTVRFSGALSLTLGMTCHRERAGRGG